MAAGCRHALPTRRPAKCGTRRTLRPLAPSKSEAAKATVRRRGRGGVPPVAPSVARRRGRGGASPVAPNPAGCRSLAREGGGGAPRTGSRGGRRGEPRDADRQRREEGAAPDLGRGARDLEGASPGREWRRLWERERLCGRSVGERRSRSRV